MADGNAAKASVHNRGTSTSLRQLRFSPAFGIQSRCCTALPDHAAWEGRIRYEELETAMPGKL